jgi:hypothetical protein
MGCDIHVYIDIVGERHTYNYADLIFDRNYNLFADMAGVRNEETGIEPVYKPRGLRKGDRISWHTEREYTLFIVSEMTASEYRTITPDKHNASWLWLDELREVQAQYLAREGKQNIDLAATIAMMEKLQSRGEPRLVFWFDN